MLVKHIYQIASDLQRIAFDLSAEAPGALRKSPLTKSVNRGTARRTKKANRYPVLK
jgi:hypothetical protein